jgi:integrase
MVATLDDSLSGRRDRALILLCFAGAFRRSELVSLDVGDLRRCREGLIVTLRRSKTDQEGQGTVKGIPRGQSAATCPVAAVEAWISAAQLRSGPLFRRVYPSGRVGTKPLAAFHLVRVVKRLAEAVGLDPALYAGHSLRAGLATAAAAAGRGERAIMRQTGHRSERSVRRYIRDGRLFHDNVADGLL